MLGVDLGQDRFDDLALSRLGQDEDVVRDRTRPLVCLPEQRPAVSTQWKDVLWGRAARTRPEPRPSPAGRYDCQGFAQPTSSASSFARAVDSHGASMSVRPKWP